MDESDQDIAYVHGECEEWLCMYYNCCYTLSHMSYICMSFGVSDIFCCVVLQNI